MVLQGPCVCSILKMMCLFREFANNTGVTRVMVFDLCHSPCLADVQLSFSRFMEGTYQGLSEVPVLFKRHQWGLKFDISCV